MAKKSFFLAAAFLAAFILSSGSSHAACVTPSNNSLYVINAPTALCAGTYGSLRIQMNTSNVTLDCNGSVLDGINKTLSAITINSSRHNTTVANCTIMRYYNGYYSNFEDSSLPVHPDHLVNNTFYNNTNGVNNSYNNWLLQADGNWFELNDFGANVQPARYYNFSRNSFINQKYSGIHFDGSGNVWYTTIDRNNFTSNISSSYGQIDASDSSVQLHWTNITNNTFESVLGRAISMTGNSMDFVNISNNRMISINSTAIYTYELNSSVIENNYISDVYDYGIELFMQHAGIYNNISNNTIMNGRYSLSAGIYIFNKFYNSTIKGNRISNFSYPLYIFDSTTAWNQIYNNILNTSSANCTNYNDTNKFNTTLNISGLNIFGGNAFGGNYWGKTNGNGFSDTCTDSDYNGICDSIYNSTNTGIVDYIPLSRYANTTNDTYAPIITGVSNYSNTNQSAMINWATNELSNSTVKYGNTTALGSVNSSSSMVTNHTINLNNLLSNMTYFYNVTSCDASGNCNTTGYYNFTTSPNDTTPPVITDVQNYSVTNQSAIIGWTTSEQANSTVKYGNTTALGSTNSSSSWATSRNISLTGLQSNTTYYYNVTSCDVMGNCNTSGTFNFTTLTTDTTPPSISGVNATNIANYSATINWTTNESSNSSVNYGLNASLGSMNSSSNMVINHSVDLLYLKANTTYYYNVTSCDASGNCNRSGTFNFTTLEVFIEIGMNWSEWDSNGTTNFTQYSAAQLENISNVTLFNQYGGIAFLENLNISVSRNLTGNIVVADLSIAVNSTGLPEFNKSANLTFSNVTLAKPIVKRDGSDCGSHCQNASYNATAGVYNVTVLSFSTYSLTEQCSDGMQNYDETGVDCGGSCSACTTHYVPSYGGGAYMPPANTSNATANTTTTTKKPANETQPEQNATKNETAPENETVVINESSGNVTANVQESEPYDWMQGLQELWEMLPALTAAVTIIVVAVLAVYLIFLRKAIRRRRLFGHRPILPRDRPPFPMDIFTSLPLPSWISSA